MHPTPKAKFLFGLLPVSPPKVTNERHGEPFYEAVADAGYKATVIRMPFEFPPTSVPSGKLWAGLGVPHVRGTWGTFYFGTDVTPWDEGNTPLSDLGMRTGKRHEEAQQV